jgi:hypothetical protein
MDKQDAQDRQRTEKEKFWRKPYAPGRFSFIPSILSIHVRTKKIQATLARVWGEETG